MLLRQLLCRLSVGLRGRGTRLAGHPDTEHTEAEEEEEDRRNRIELPSCAHAISPRSRFWRHCRPVHFNFITGRLRRTGTCHPYGTPQNQDLTLVGCYFTRRDPSTSGL